jgi:2-isopropylmalate synthase
LMLRKLGLAQDHFSFVSFRVFDDKWHEDQAPFSEAVVIIEGPDGRRTRTSAIGNGPVNALDSALRSALLPYYPTLEKMQLVDYKVRVLDDGSGTDARVRVLIESTDGSRQWGTVGLSTNVIEASWQALVDSIEFKLHKDKIKARSPRPPAAKTARLNGVGLNGVGLNGHGGKSKSLTVKPRGGKGKPIRARVLGPILRDATEG